MTGKKWHATGVPYWLFWAGGGVMILLALILTSKGSEPWVIVGIAATGAMNLVLGFVERKNGGTPL